jgi:hypothetical protein
VTTADKLPNNYVIVCLKHYVPLVEEDICTPLDEGGFYELGAGGVDVAAQKVRDAAQEAASYVFDSGTNLTDQRRSSILCL